MEVIRPAVEGTKNVLEACAKTKGGVKRVVLTSSTAAICGNCNGFKSPFHLTNLKQLHGWLQYLFFIPK